MRAPVVSRKQKNRAAPGGTASSGSVRVSPPLNSAHSWCTACAPMKVATTANAAIAPASISFGRLIRMKDCNSAAQWQEARGPGGAHLTAHGAGRDNRAMAAFKLEKVLNWGTP